MTPDEQQQLAALLSQLSFPYGVELFRPTPTNVMIIAVEVGAEGDEADVVDALKKVKWPVSTAMFNALLGAVPTAAIELVVFIEDDASGTVNPGILLLPRPDNDPFFKGLVHGAGTVLRLGDTEESALERVISQELGSAANVSKPQFVGVQHVAMGPLPDHCPRGQEVGLVYRCVWQPGAPLPQNAIIADPAHLPENLIGFHRPIISKALAQYRNE